MKKLSLLTFMLSFLLIAKAQLSGNNYNLLFKSGNIIPPENVSEMKQKNALNQFESFNQHYYLILQFRNIPDLNERQRIESAGIKLLTYIPHYAFIASVPESFNPVQFEKFNLRSVVALESNYKLSKDLLNGNIPAHAELKTGHVDLLVLPFADIKRTEAIAALVNTGAEIIKTSDNLRNIKIRVAKDQINSIASLAFIEYVEAIPPQSIHDDTKGRSLHRSNAINSELSTGLHYDGTGITVAVADDGSISHIDFKGRLTDLTEQGQAGSHGDMTSGICVGAGNLNPAIQGMANGAHLVLFDIYNSSLGDYPQIVNAVSNYNNYGVTFVSTSYSQGCNDYTSDTQFGDGLLYNNPQLEFIFSAGNNNGNDCGYGAGGQWGNVTGGYKQGKNVIACANIDANGTLDNSSSHGPASDGRVKPDISANGKDQLSTDENNTYQTGGGTSAASPGVAGVCAQLGHAYKELNGGNEINTALLKGILLNTAVDLGNAGPDYKFGWGRINALRAYNVLSNNQYALDSVDQGTQKSFTITVPAGTFRLKAMIYWHDYEGSPSASKALVNDLNLTVTDPTSNVLYPLILDPTPNATNLNALAVPGVDTLNNMEQVVVTLPAAGTYTVNVDGFEVPMGPQRFYLVWDIVEEGIKLTYPNGGEGFISSQSEVIRWDASDDANPFSVEYSTDNGLTWFNFANNITASARQYTFSNPAVSTDQALIRVSRGNQSDVSDNPFSIFPAIQNLQVVFECPDSVGLQWTGVNGATAYEVSMLGAKYMDSVATSTGTTATVTGTNPNDDKWFSVRAIGPNGGKGRRVNAIFKPSGVINCPLAFDNEMISVISPGAGTFRNCPSNGSIPVSIHFRSLSLNPVSNFPVSYQFNNGPVITETFTGTLNTFDTATHLFSTSINLTTPGNYSFAAWIDLPGDMNNFNDSISFTISVIDGNLGVPPLVEDMETSFPPFGFQIVNPDNDDTWEDRIVIGANSTITTTAFVDNYSYNAPGEEDYFETRVYDLTGFNNAIMTFDLAYAAYSSAYEDALRIDISIDCGGTYIPTGYFKQGLVLSTIPNYSTAASWQPSSASEWRNDTVDLSAFAGQEVILRFANICNYGNSMHIDNINVAPFTVGVNEVNANSNISVFPNPAKDLINIVDLKSTIEPVTIQMYDVSGKLIKSLEHNFSNNGMLQLDVSNYGSGVYTIELKSQSQLSRHRVILN